MSQVDFLEVSEYVNPEYPDLYLPNGVCYIWFQFEPDEIYAEVSLVPVSCLKEDHWLSDEAAYNGFDFIFLITPSGRIGEWLDFILRQGLYLYQPFLVAFDAPNGYRCNHPLDPEEWDVEYNWEIVHRVHPTPEMVEDMVKFLEEVTGL